ncbi:MAG: adenosylcobinamide-GDP ribazoletransferase [Marmoricola sp.]
MSPVRQSGRAVLAAFSFLTVLPIARRVVLDGTDVARGSVLFPVVGAAIGATTGGAAWYLGDHLPPLLAAVLAVALGAAVTGALHLDGLADCADGFGARTPEDRLRVMRDHTNGTYGGTALLLDLMIRVAALSALAGTKEALLFSVAAGALSRMVGPVLTEYLPYAQARPGAGEALSAHPSLVRAWVTTVVASALAFPVLMNVGVGADGVGHAYPAALGTSFAVIVLVGWTSHRRLGGVTGDVMGACSELVEIAVLTVLVGVLR